MRHTTVAFLVCTPVAFCSASHADTIAADPASYLARLSRLQPGDVLELAPGTYTQGLPLAALAGTRTAPIVIHGPEGQSAVFTGTVRLDGASYVDVSNL